MSSESRRQPTGRISPRKETERVSKSSIEGNLEKLGFLAAPKTKKARKGESSHRAVGFRSSASDTSRTTSRASQRSEAPTSSRLHGGRSSSGMVTVMDHDRSRSRKDRTFIGGECAVCEEQLELTLRGERILQLSCGHIAHEACFYEYLREIDAHSCPTCEAPLGLDSSRGGSVPNIDILSNAVRSNASVRQRSYEQPPQNINPTPWEQRTITETSSIVPSLRMQQTQDVLMNRSRSITHQPERTGIPGSVRHARNGSDVTNAMSATEFAESQGPIARRHDYDVQSMETSLGSPRAIIVKNPIPPPTVTVRSEFPTLTRSRQQQSLTCLITVEVSNMEAGSVPTLRQGGSTDFGGLTSPPPPHRQSTSSQGLESPEDLERITEELHLRVDNWHGLDFSRFGKLLLHSQISVGKDRQTWQDLDCYLFAEMLICVKERRATAIPQFDMPSASRRTKCTLKGSILIKRHLREVNMSADDNTLTLSLSVVELPAFYLQFRSRSLLENWRRVLLEINSPQSSLNRHPEYDLDNSGTDEEDYKTNQTQRLSSVNSSYGAAKSYNTAPTEYSNSRGLGLYENRFSQPIRVPLDVVVVIPISSSMQGLKISLLRDTLRFLVNNLGERDRMGLVTFGSGGGGVPIVGMTGQAWGGWLKVLDSIRPVGQKSLRADVVEGANVAMDLLMQRKSANPLASILLISDASTSDAESVDFVVQRAEAAKVAIYSFGLGLAHKPDTMIELSTRTKASYTYVKDWMMLRECLAGVVGSLQTTSHQNVKLKLHLPEGSPAKFVKISGAFHYTKRATGRDAEAALGDLRFGDKRDILVQLVVSPENVSSEQLPQDPWESIVSGLEALGGSLDQDEQRNLSIEEVPLIQADLIYGDVQREGAVAQLPRQSLLAITMLPGPRSKAIARPVTPPIPPHPSVVQRRMELLTSDMLMRALTLVSRGQHERAQHLLTETRSILKGLGKGGLPPLPPGGPPTVPQTRQLPPLPSSSASAMSPTTPVNADPNPEGSSRRTPSPPQSVQQPMSPLPPLSAGTPPFPSPASLIDSRTVAALEAELDSSLEWITHPAVFSRDSRKAVLQAIGVISSQRGYSFRTPVEGLWAERIVGIKRMAERAREWRETTGQQGMIDGGVVVEER